MIIIFQNLKFLLQIFSSSELRLNNIIKIFWLSKFFSTNKNLKLFLNIWKNKILIILHYFIQHNHFYHDFTINNIMIKNWFEKFISSEIADNVICLKNSDHHEYKHLKIFLLFYKCFFNFVFKWFWWSLRKKSVSVLLEAFAKWVLNHHNRKLIFVSNCKNSSKMIRKLWETWLNDIIILK